MSLLLVPGLFDYSALTYFGCVCVFDQLVDQLNDDTKFLTRRAAVGYKLQLGLSEKDICSPQERSWLRRQTWDDSPHTSLGSKRLRGLFYLSLIHI